MLRKGNIKKQGTLSHALSFVNDLTGHCNRPTLYHASTTSDTPLHAAPLQLSSIQQQATKQQTMPCNTPGNEPHQPYAILSTDRLSSLDCEGKEQMVTGHGIALPESCTLSKGFPAFKSTAGGVEPLPPLSPEPDVKFHVSVRGWCTLQVVVPQKLFIMHSRTSFFPSSTLSLIDVKPDYDEGQQTIHLQVCCHKKRQAF